MITLEQAHERVERYLGKSGRARHSIFVGYLMRRLAERLGGDTNLWESVGLCHDLDYFETADARHLHGVIAASWLDDDLPSDALTAIKAHDHRTGIHADTLLSDALKLADALAVADVAIGRSWMKTLRDSASWDMLRAKTSDRPYLAPIIADLAGRHDLSLPVLADMCLAGPPQ
ncbi:HD domain-containing protein [Pelagibacterium xiamenense]|uniref:HD domain-containing protein n=1 Tax=Pelagibacterium xiamenense TaxID=2901140 RepID=UPI001E50FFA6|nr:HD domain-containing protein [Pelagibacterium xiamenense]MCD7059397.1 HD domain-containing protein [Pelagibacterium xiamenense]